LTPSKIISESEHGVVSFVADKVGKEGRRERGEGRKE
jgi:hypothetical protein